MASDLHPQIEHDPLTRQLHGVGLGVLQGERSNQHAQEQQPECTQAGQIARRDVAIDRDLREVRLSELQHRVAHDAGQGSHDREPVWPQVAQQPPHQPRIVRPPQDFFFVNRHRFRTSPLSPQL